MAMPNITKRKRPTHSPEREAVVMLSNIFEVTLLLKGAVCKILGLEGVPRSAVMMIGLVWASNSDKISETWRVFSSTRIATRPVLSWFKLSVVARKELILCLSIGRLRSEERRAARSLSVMGPSSVKMGVLWVERYWISCCELRTAW